MIDALDVDIERLEMKEILKNNLNTIFNYSLFITGNREKAMDLMQDTIVNLLNKKQPYQEQAAFKSWIFKVLKNNYINKYKRDNLHREINETDLTKDSTMSFDFEDTVTDTEKTVDPFLREKILGAFSIMPVEYREVCYMIDVEGFSYEEASEQLDIPIGTVMSRLHRGRNFLQGKLNKEAVELRIVSERKRKHA